MTLHLDGPFIWNTVAFLCGMVAGAVTLIAVVGGFFWTLGKAFEPK